MIRRLELLAPAKNAEFGIAAVESGADAVYIGAPKFGARAAAGNAPDDIRRLAEYAHRFRAKVYLALNTILYDNELAEAEAIARQAIEAGVDALIVQDMALAEMNLPIPLHASTQTFNLSPQKAVFFEKAGFSRLILERAIGLDEIKEIHAKAPGIELEAFVHGAICVGYSGQCYLSQTVAGRSGNRGECMQPCRWDFNLTGEPFQRLATAKHLLSVADLNLSGQLEPLIDAGVTSFKIEGRLKDLTYLKNSTAFYRQRLDAIIARRPDLARASAGETAFDFTPDPEKSFSRGFSEYYLVDPANRVASFDTPKSIGQYVGEVRKVARDSFVLDGDARLSAGDGLFFLSGGGEFGTSVNRAEGRAVWPNRMEGIAPGTKIYRNHDHAFVKSLDRSKTRRTIAVQAVVSVDEHQLTLALTDGEGNRVEKTLLGYYDFAQNPLKAEETIRQQTGKSGETIFRVESVQVRWDVPRFVAASQLNALRREALDEIDRLRQRNYRREERKPADETTLYPQSELDYRANVTNRLAEQFYKKHGVTALEPGFELRDDWVGKEVMRTRYCIRREMGQCLQEKSCSYRGPMQLENNYYVFALTFDCARCEMALIYKGNRR
jgi:putative protease